MDFDMIVYLLSHMSAMTMGAAIFFSVVVCCLFMMANRLLDIAICAVKMTGRGIQNFARTVGEVMFTDEVEIEPEPPVRKTRPRN